MGIGDGRNKKEDGTGRNTQRREEDELGRGDGRNKTEDGNGRREEDALGRGRGRLRREAERDGKDRQVKPNR